jgi:hypothetical protein
VLEAGGDRSCPLASHALPAAALNIRHVPANLHDLRLSIIEHLPANNTALVASEGSCICMDFCFCMDFSCAILLKSAWESFRPNVRASWFQSTPDSGVSTAHLCHTPTLVPPFPAFDSPGDRLKCALAELPLCCSPRRRGVGRSM